VWTLIARIFLLHCNGTGIDLWLEIDCDLFDTTLSTLRLVIFSVNIIKLTFLLLPTWYTNFLFIHTNYINPLNAELNPICYLLVLLAHHFLHVSRIRVKFNSSKCFEHNPLIIRRSTTQIVHMQPLVSSLCKSELSKLLCLNLLYNLCRWPPHDERIALETYRGI
jgi:hypothetical protein